ncbi:hypothetical protein TD95_001847 [Thielaviopsis punctulata]|uniref:Transcription factor CBF/NF-Y/archaeal histone domain-containing protein n=1 Tax=Thielaviopsis punctulata TaxID=72032 RepID=A0A0F4ZCM5_9PEZI|nr:hypothetical protein TD95_001847 [Thielaviopsis punctulata]
MAEPNRGPYPPHQAYYADTQYQYQQQPHQQGYYQPYASSGQYQSQHYLQQQLQQEQYQSQVQVQAQAQSPISASTSASVSSYHAHANFAHQQNSPLNSAASDSPHFISGSDPALSSSVSTAGAFYNYAASATTHSPVPATTPASALGHQQQPASLPAAPISSPPVAKLNLQSQPYPTAQKTPATQAQVQAQTQLHAQIQAQTQAQGQSQELSGQQPASQENTFTAQSNAEMPPRRAAAVAAAATIQSYSQSGSSQSQSFSQSQQTRGSAPMTNLTAIPAAAPEPIAESAPEPEHEPEVEMSSMSDAAPMSASAASAPISMSAASLPPLEPAPVKTKFPTARIKRIMQADEEVGKVAQQAPIAVGKALELFMIGLVMKSAEVARQRGQKRISTAMMKQVIETDEQWDFLRDISGKIDTEEKPARAGRAPKNHESTDSEDESHEPKKKGRGRKKKVAV